MTKEGMPSIDVGRFSKKKHVIEGDIIFFHDSDTKVVMNTKEKIVFESNTLYIYKTDENNHKFFRNVYLLLKPYKVFNKLVYFDILDKAKYLETINKDTTLRGFRDSIVDSNYFDSIPLVNELFHNDNFIITNVSFEFTNKTTYDPLNVQISFEEVEGEIRVVNSNKEHLHNGKNIIYTGNKKQGKNSC